METGPEDRDLDTGPVDAAPMTPSTLDTAPLAGDPARVSDDPLYDDTAETHATTPGAAAAGAIAGGVIGLAGGPVTAAAGFVGGAVLGAVSERIMHAGDDHGEDAADGETAPSGPGYGARDKDILLEEHSIGAPEPIDDDFDRAATEDPDGSWRS